jgi:hypothetical protein
MKEKELRRLSLPVHDICVIGKRRELDPERVPRLRSRSSGLGFSAARWLHDLRKRQSALQVQ